MQRKGYRSRIFPLVAVAVLLQSLAAAAPAHAASHRETPLIALDPAADPIEV
jgi:hypothetical protein